MQLKVNTPDEYIAQLSEDRQQAISFLRKVLLDNLPNGFVECISYGMIGYVVPHRIYPNGYHCDSKLPLPFINIASQKNFIVLYHMGIYANPKIMDWFLEEYPKYCEGKPDMGKGCIRFKKMDKIPYPLIGALAAKISVEEWINWYEVNLKSVKKNK